MIINDDNNYWSYFDWHCNLLIMFWFWKLWFSDYTIYSYTIMNCVIIFYQVDHHSCVLQQCVLLELLLTFLNIGIRLTSLVKEIHVSRNITYVRYKWHKFFILHNCLTYSRPCKFNVKICVTHFTHNFF